MLTRVGRSWRIGFQPPSPETIPGLRNTPVYAEGDIGAVALALRRAQKEAPLNVVTPIAEQPNLRPYQNSGVSFMLEKLRSCGFVLNADDMGLGKTRQAAVTASMLGGRILIACPAKVRESWKAELERLGQHSWASLEPGGWNSRPLAPISGNAVRWVETCNSAQWVLTSYQLLPRAYQEAGGGFTTFIADELHNLSGNGPLAKNARNIRATCKYAIGLTGTPVDDVPWRLYNMFLLLAGRSIFGSKTDFETAYCGARPGEHGGLVKPKGEAWKQWVQQHPQAMEELRLRLSYYVLRREKKDVGEQLPRLTRQVLWLDADPKATHALHMAKLSRTSAGTEAGLEATLRAKIPAVVDLALEARKSLVLTTRKWAAEALTERLEEEGLYVYLITGDLTPGKRQQYVKQAAEEGATVVATVDAVGEGLDGLQYLSNVGIMHGLHFRPLVMRQGEKRLDRMPYPLGGVTVYYPALRNSMDELVLDTILPKMEAAAALIGDSGAAESAESLGAGLSDENANLALYAALPDGEVESGEEWDDGED
jgi:superfamily II DNA or RNA helicase